MAAPQLALGSGQRRRDPHLSTFGVVVAAVAMVVAFGTLLGVWWTLKLGTAVWPPKGVTIENYYGTTLSVTMLMAVLAAEWTAYGVRKQERSQVVAASVLLVGFGLAFLNLLTYVAKVSHFGPGTHAYGAVFYAFTILMLAAVVSAVAMSLLSLIRFLGGQVSAAEPALVRSAAWFWWATGVGWLVMYAAVWVIK
jgi:heme/copper-type cytochrome/quinol oxidase subunit 3